MAQQSIKQVKDSVHVSYYAERSCAVEDPNGESFLLDCVNAMCSNFTSYYSTFDRVLMCSSSKLGLHTLGSIYTHVRLKIVTRSQIDILLKLINSVGV